MTRIALVTGAARAAGIAAGIVPRLRIDGWHVITSDLGPSEWSDPETHIECDLADARAAEELIPAVTARFGPISALVLSQAHDVETGVLDTTAASFDRHMAVNARASLLLIAAFARQAPHEGGAVVALTSDHTTGNLPYGVSKGALDRLVISAARELGPRGISANVLNPGPIDTGWMPPGFDAELTAATPLRRLGRPHDIGEVVAFLLSDAGRWMSGQLLFADGAFSARI